ncbi:hypothetical protein BT69DRAFT_367662 [Atractiella rhizophila]|nr:hypothetical protein BT69DRAFT_367662 [Atractiella rhizophila]
MATTVFAEARVSSWHTSQCESCLAPERIIQLYERITYRWTIIVPQFFGSIALLYDAHRLPASPSPSHPTSNSQNIHGQRRKLTDIELQQHDQNRQRSVFEGSEPIRISVAMSASASENNDDASTVHLSDDKPVVVDLAASTRDGEEPRRETRTMMWNEKQRPSQWTKSR